jgi:hypothetical protein
MLKNPLILLAIIAAQFIYCQPNFTWAVPFGGPDQERGFDVAVDASQNVYSTGDFGGTTDFDPGPSTYYLSAMATTDGYISKLNSAGGFVWAKQIASSFPKTITTDLSGNVYVHGFFTAIVDFDPGPSTYTMKQQESFLF